MPAFDEYEDELTSVTVGAFAGLSSYDPTDQLKPKLDPWADDRWILKRARAFETKEEGDDALEQAVARSVVGGTDVVGDDVADRRAAAAGADPTNADTSLLQLARSQLGVDYVWAAADPGEGFDCSGFTQWVLKRYGIGTQHMASLQQQQFAQVGREELQPGDLVFFNYGRKAAGVADHVGLYIGNGMMIDASSSQDQIVERAVDWDHFLHGGATGIDANSGNVAFTESAPKKTRVKTTAPRGAAAQEAARALGEPEPNALARAIGGIYGSPAGQEAVPPAVQKYKGKNASTKAELYRGFMDAGRPDLAAMVGTPEFDAWIAQESGWQVGVTSPANNHGLANDGLFQVWRGHQFNDGGQVAGMSAYDQAMLVSQHFNLTPDDIRRYAQQIAAGEYHGWG